jgi:asparagine synthase (glutamine-hydrolysing)
MCGICLYASKNIIYDGEREKIFDNFNIVRHRGPDKSANIGRLFESSLPILSMESNVIMTFHRLSMTDLSNKGMQPFKFYNETTNEYVTMMCNGEIYNYKKLIVDYNLHVESGSDCGVIIPLYIKFGFKKMIELIHGEFVIVLMSIRQQYQKFYVARDRVGVRPIFYFINNNVLGVCSELKGLLNICGECTINPFPIGTIMKFSFDKPQPTFNQYYKFDQCSNFLQKSLEEIKNIGFNLLVDVVVERMASDRPIGALLSGGFDSSTIAGIMSAELDKKNIVLNTFCIGLVGGTDLKYAREVANYIKSNHVEIIIDIKDALSVIPDVIGTIESYDITSVRASVWQYMISKYISQNTNIKCVLVGEGPDELCQGYQYFKNAPSSMAGHIESIERVQELYMFDLLRVDRCISGFGLEARVPYLDHKFIDFYLSIDPKYRCPQNIIEGTQKEEIKDNHNLVEKWLLREFVKDRNIIPECVRTRPKVAFSDGTSCVEKSWFQEIQEFIDTIVTDEEYNMNRTKYTHLPPISKEAYYYRKIFEEKFGSKHVNVITKYWLPKWSGDVTDPSARILKVHREN